MTSPASGAARPVVELHPAAPLPARARVADAGGPWLREHGVQVVSLAATLALFAALAPLL